MIHWDAIAAAINHATDVRFEISTIPLSGGGINKSFRISNKTGQHFFVKLNTAAKHSMFAAESQGLKELASTHTIRVPQSVTLGKCGTHSFLVLEYIDLGGAHPI